jgi:hypothetical protein
MNVKEGPWIDENRPSSRDEDAGRGVELPLTQLGHARESMTLDTYSHVLLEAD